MAEKTDGQICSICLNDSRQPKVLHCKHFFCYTCLEDYVQKNVIDGHFGCPLCACEVTLPEGGVKDLPSKSKNNFTRCDGFSGLCQNDNAQMRCRDCEQNLCQACSEVHGTLKICKNHVVVGLDEAETEGEKPDKGTCIGNNDTNDTKDGCQCQQKDVEYLCTDCLLLVCSKCYIISHNGHKFLDLQEETARKQINDELSTLTDGLNNQVTKLEKFSVDLNMKNDELTDLVKSLCDQFDQQSNKICTEVTRIRDHFKDDIKKIYLQDEAENCSETTDVKYLKKSSEISTQTKQLRKLMVDTKTKTDELQASVKNSANVLEENSIVQVMERLSQVQHEYQDCSSRQLIVPDVPKMFFKAASIDKSIFSQLGKILPQGEKDKSNGGLSGADVASKSSNGLIDPAGFRGENGSPSLNTQSSYKLSTSSDVAQTSQRPPKSSNDSEAAQASQRQPQNRSTGTDVGLSMPPNRSMCGNVAPPLQTEPLSRPTYAHLAQFGGDVTLGGCHGETRHNEGGFGHSFNKDEIRIDEYCLSPDIKCVGLPWCVSVKRWNDDDVGFRVTLKNVVGRRIKACIAECTIKLVNVIDDRKSLIKSHVHSFLPGGAIALYCTFIAWGTLINPHNGFLDNNQFHVEVSLKDLILQ